MTGEDNYSQDRFPAIQNMYNSSRYLNFTALHYTVCKYTTLQSTYTTWQDTYTFLEFLLQRPFKGSGVLQKLKPDKIRGKNACCTVPLSYCMNQEHNHCNGRCLFFYPVLNIFFKFILFRYFLLDIHIFLHAKIAISLTNPLFRLEAKFFSLPFSHFFASKQNMQRTLADMQL